MVLCLVLVLLCITYCPFKFCNHLDEEDRAGCFTVIVFLMSCLLWLFLMVPLVGGLQCVIVVFPDHTEKIFRVELTRA